MASITDVEAIKLIESIAKDFEKNAELAMPEWAQFVKSGAHAERPPAQENWWYIRQAALLRTIYKDGPVGVSKLRTKYGGRKNRGRKPEKFYKASGKIIRTMLQQLDKAGYVTLAKQGSKGRIVTPQGQAILDNTSNLLLGKSKTTPKPTVKKETKLSQIKPSNEVAEADKKPMRKDEETKNELKKVIGKEDTTNKSTKSD
ncbi:30S ribosomal protein S19e [Candidatus Woesearchaeota archaeon]|nr:30S ribosomal protein S19e [Candidatus Woesearchaeota archaeon]MBT4114674.1 30S ribosomal protein S19e [Candidatus Woesearchaeota archaeon]MBT4248522.1 30S ribosomal protein S19e [Candidatus Woesearchaeota archaeon]